MVDVLEGRQSRTLSEAWGEGLETALVVRPAPHSEFFSPDPEKRMTVLEILALPLNE